jgi:hypothetical protein
MESSEQDNLPASGILRSNLGHIQNLAQASSDAMIDAHLRLYRQIEAINRKWFDRLSETRDSEVALGNNLRNCADPAQAGALCREWVVSRGAIMASDMESFGKLWLDFCSQAISSGQQPLPSESSKAG